MSRNRQAPPRRRRADQRWRVGASPRRGGALRRRARSPRGSRAAARPAPRTETHARDDGASPRAPRPTGRPRARRAGHRPARAVATQPPLAAQAADRRRASHAVDPRSRARAIRRGAAVGKVRRRRVVRRPVSELDLRDRRAVAHVLVEQLAVLSARGRRPPSPGRSGSGRPTRGARQPRAGR